MQRLSQERSQAQHIILGLDDCILQLIHELKGNLSSGACHLNKVNIYRRLTFEAKTQYN
jgi:hypothetical protein